MRSNNDDRRDSLPEGHRTVSEIPPEHRETVAGFLGRYFKSSPSVGAVPDLHEQRAIETVVQYVSERISASKYVLGLALDFALLAQQLSDVDGAGRERRPSFDQRQIFKRYQLVEARGSTQANTLTLVYGDKKFGIRKLEEDVCRLFIALNRPSYPSAYVYNTGQWKKYVDPLLVPTFQLSERGRQSLCCALIALGLATLSPGVTVRHSGRRPRAFDLVLSEYTRSCPKENAGMALQGISYGFFHADRPHLSLVVDKSRTGSARQRRIGDIDGYLGQSLELCVEVKDIALRSENVETEFEEFLSRLARIGAPGIAVVDSADSAARAILAASGVQALTIAEMLRVTTLWDWHKQELAMQGFLHFVANIEQSPDAVKRLLEFVQSVDPQRSVMEG